MQYFQIAYGWRMGNVISLCRSKGKPNNKVQQQQKKKDNDDEKENERKKKKTFP